MTVGELIAKLPHEFWKGPVYFKIGGVSYPVTHITQEKISDNQTLVVLSNTDYSSILPTIKEP